MQQKHRPIGVTIIAILTIIGGIGFLASGIAAVVAAPFLSDMEALSAGIGAALIALGIASIAIGNIGAIFHIIINAIVVYYLYRPHVKAFFGKPVSYSSSASDSASKG